ncbi:MAG: hypothetical protein ACRCY8_02905 [Dermatophilaceae bacterium]
MAAPVPPVDGTRSWSRLSSGVVAAALASVVVTAAVLRGVTGSGPYLVRDFVAVPRPARPRSFLPATPEALRAWPLDAASWAASWLVPTGVQQRLLLTACVLLAGCGAGLLAARWGPGPAVAASWLAAWNPYVAERLLLGQAPTLLAYACLPWLVLAVRRCPPGPLRLLAVAAASAPAALTPWGGTLAVSAVLAAVLSRHDRSVRSVLTVTSVPLVCCLPWMVPALLVGGVSADPDGAVAFAIADDTGLGVWLSGLTGGGIWAEGARPASRSSVLAQAASLVGVALALGGGLWWARRRDRRAVLALVAVLAPATMAWFMSGPALGALTALQRFPGAALVRDQHRTLAPAVLAMAVLLAVVVHRVATADRVAGLLAGCVLAPGIAVATVPDLPSTLAATYRSTAFPGDWDEALSALVRDADRPVVLSLPWQPLRRPSWAGATPFLDPLPRAVPGEVLSSTQLRVRRDGRLLVVDDTPRAEAADWVAGRVDPASLSRHGVTHVVEWLGTPGALPMSRGGWRVVHRGPGFVVWDVRAAR